MFCPSSVRLVRQRRDPATSGQPGPADAKPGDTPRLCKRTGQSCRLKSSAARNRRHVDCVERLASGHAFRTLPKDPPRRAALPSRRSGEPSHHVGHRPRPGHPPAEQGLLGVPGHDHRVQAAWSVVRRLPPALPLDRTHPVLAAGRGALDLRGHRRRLPQEPRDHHGTPLQPHEAKPGRGAGPRPHHQRGHPRHGSGHARVPRQAGPDPVSRPGLSTASQRDHRGEGHRLSRGVASLASTSPAPSPLPSTRPTTRAPSSAPTRKGWASPSTPASRVRSRRSRRSSSNCSPTASATA